MVTLYLNVTIDEFIASTDSIIEVYLNHRFIGCLHSKLRNFEYNGILADKENNIVIKRKYLKPELLKKRGFIKSALSSVVSLVLMAGSMIEPFECPYEWENTLKLSDEGEFPRISIACIQHEDDQYPRFYIDKQHCSLSSEKVISISRDELMDFYSERKRMICVISSLVAVLLAVVSLSLIHNNLTTIVFLLAIFGIVMLCTICSLINLKKEYLKKQNCQCSTGDGTAM